MILYIIAKKKIDFRAKKIMRDKVKWVNLPRRPGTFKLV